MLPASCSSSAISPGSKTRPRSERYLAPLRKREWVVYAKRPFAGPAQVLAYLARYTHRVAIANSRLLALDDDAGQLPLEGLSRERPQKTKVMRLGAGEFMRRFLLHVLPDGFHRIRHYGLFANGHRAEKLALCRKLLGAVATSENIDDCPSNEDVEAVKDPPACPCCGGRMTIIETFERGSVPRNKAFSPVRLDSS